MREKGGERGKGDNSSYIVNESTKVQNPRRNSYAGLTHSTAAGYARTYITLASCTAHARASASVGLRLYLACFTPVAPVASL